MEITEKDRAYCLSRGYTLRKREDGMIAMEPTEEKTAEIIARNKAIGRYINSDENLKLLGLK